VSNLKNTEFIIETNVSVISVIPVISVRFAGICLENIGQSSGNLSGRVEYGALAVELLEQIGQEHIALTTADSAQCAVELVEQIGQ